VRLERLLAHQGLLACAFLLTLAGPVAPAGLGLLSHRSEAPQMIQPMQSSRLIYSAVLSATMPYKHQDAFSVKDLPSPIQRIPALASSIEEAGKDNMHEHEEDYGGNTASQPQAAPRTVLVASEARIGSTETTRLDRCREYGQEHGLAIVREFVLATGRAQTGQSCARQLLEEREHDVLQFDTLLGFTVSEIVSDETELEEILQMAVASGMQLETVREGCLTLDGNHIEVARARLAYKGVKSRLLRASAAVRAEALRSRGCPIGRAPLGYKSSRTPDGDPTFVWDEERANIISQLFTLARQGSTTHELALFALKQGLVALNGLPLSPAQILKLLRSPIYMGIVGDSDATGNFTPIVNRETFAAVQALLGSRVSKTRNPLAETK
jgi:hypothetical protein